MINTLISSLFFAITITTAVPIRSSDTDVYICKGPRSKKYHHRKNCRGLKRCSTRIYKVCLKEATNKGRTLCGWED
ncbi:hypothetical protein [Aquimarina sp. RZ0]|uniref:hypothetical protein n=1 Tax=Aquimarina sp. RZ0 TaxID=2607730 RepID=UPI0011F30661|nr:hypothetical protein [Aquimarina sp. RZ0]KAA1245876.1 hypothetical protein F0000_09970 [Aquimarina sp. RZ0]